MAGRSPSPAALALLYVIDLSVSDVYLQVVRMAHQTVVETPEFIRRADATGMSKQDRDALISQLAVNPEAGVSLGGGLRKVRLARQGSGKSGGYRVLYFYHTTDLPIFLLTVFAKNEKANISRAEKTSLIELCDLIARTYEKRL